MPFNSTPDAFQLHPDVRSYGTTLRLSESKSNLVCLHARGGVGCGAARMLRFVAASYLCYAGVHDDVVDAFDALASPPPSRA